MKQDLKPSLPQFILAVISLVGLIAIALSEAWFDKVIDSGMKQIIIGFATLAYAFFFQSSSGSKQKDETIATQAQAVAKVVAPELSKPAPFEPPKAMASMRYTDQYTDTQPAKEKGLA